MDNIEDKIVYLRVGKAENCKHEIDGKIKEFRTAIKKSDIKSSYLSKSKFLDDEQVYKYHGGVDKAVLFFSKKSYEVLSSEAKSNLSFEHSALLGENILLENLDENSVCIGDIFKIGEAIIEISQPREPCSKLSINSNIPNLKEIIENLGLSGWYGRVLKEGVVDVNDSVIVQKNEDRNLSIINLNMIAKEPIKNIDLYKKAISSDVLGSAFKKFIQQRFEKESKH